MAKLIALAQPHSELGVWVNPDNIAFIAERGDGLSNIHFVGGGQPVTVAVEPEAITTLVEMGNAKRT